MKKIAKPLFLILVMTSLLCVSAFAKTESGHPATGENVKYTTEADSPIGISAVDNSNEYFAVSATGGVPGAQYLLLVLKQTNDATGGEPVFAAPTESNIIYIDQTAADENGRITFDKVFPTAIAMKEQYEVHIVGGTDGNLKTYGASKTTFSYDYVTYTLGDVDEDNAINSTDAVLILKHAAQQITLTGNQLLAADTDHDGTLNSTDAVLILKYAAQLIRSF